MTIARFVSVTQVMSNKKGDMISGYQWSLNTSLVFLKTINGPLNYILKTFKTLRGQNSSANIHATKEDRSIS